MLKLYLVIRNIDTQEEIRRIDVDDKSDPEIIQITNELLEQIDTDNYYIDEDELGEPPSP